MTFLRNSWYCAGWSSDLVDKPIGRTMLGEYLVFYRGLGGRPVAVSGRCPHRFAPLDRGVVFGDTIMCPYHGLRFGSDGKCVRNPHGDGHIPPRARLVSYPIVEKNGTLWVWMGDIECADESLLPEENFLVNPAYSGKTCSLKVHANYQLVIDNLLDLTHGPFLHPTTLSASRKDSAGLKLEYSFRTEGNVIHSDYHYASIPPAPLMRSLFTEATGELLAKMAWAPAPILNFDLSLHPVGGGKGGVHMPSFHYIVPETEFTTHYFAAIARDVKIDDPAEDERMIDYVMRAFTDEDEPMIRACQELMGTTDLFSLKPAILKTDTPAVQARRMIAKLLGQEESALALAAE